ncbi:MAG: hypothetical protein QOI01_6960 [Mycobacterium sp.]|jgi:hypothetical protein|nr:hypothetical protein [Mycobacterium sp.]
MGAQLSKPGGISHVGLAARQVLDVSGIDQHHLHARQILQQVVERLPIVAGGFDDDARNLLCAKMIPQQMIWRVVAPNVVTVSLVLRRPAPWIRTHTLASFLEISRPAQRG